MKEKTCKVCSNTKPVNFFYKASNTKDGYRGKCKSCFKKTNKDYRKSKKGIKWRLDYYQVNKEKIKETRKKYEKTDKYKHIKSKIYNKKLKEGKLYAYCKIQRALKAGHIKRKNVCDSCGKSCKKSHFHHVEGYEIINALNVVEICPTCHGKEHRHSVSL